MREPGEAHDILFKSRKEAETVLNAMNDILDQYGTVTLSDFYDLSGFLSSKKDYERGWTSLEGVTVEQNNSGGYFVNLPRAMPLPEVRGFKAITSFYDEWVKEHGEPYNKHDLAAAFAEDYIHTADALIDGHMYDLKIPECDFRHAIVKDGKWVFPNNFDKYIKEDKNMPSNIKSATDLTFNFVYIRTPEEIERDKAKRELQEKAAKKIQAIQDQLELDMRKVDEEYQEKMRIRNANKEAANVRAMYQAYVDAGFSKDEAMAMIMAEFNSYD